MNWIKKNYDRVALVLLSLTLAGSSGYLVWQGRQFSNSFEAVLANPPHGSKVAIADDVALLKARESLAKAAAWKDSHPGSLFVSRPYLVVNDVLVDPIESDTMVRPPVPNKWFSDHGLDLTDSNILNEDPDGDGFSNLDEFLGNTNPQDKTSHPAYVTKLRLVQWKKIQFRLKFAAYDDNTFQINTLDVRQPSQFVKLGDVIGGTKFKVLKFNLKKIPIVETGGERDVSELTVQNTETQEMVALVLDTVVNSPDSYAVFHYIWNDSEFTVKKDGKFVLRPETTVEYKVVDIRDTEAVIKNLKTSGPEIKIPRLEATAR